MILIFLLVEFFLLIFCGFVIFNFFFKSRNKLLLLGASMITGPLAFLFILSILSYVLKGKTAIQIIFLFFVFSCAYIFFKRNNLKDIWGKLRHFKFWQNKLVLIPLLVYVFLIFLYASSFAIGADGDLYWGIATSFTRGNYPTVLPWQPNYLTVYHEGTFIVEGALRALSPVGIAAIHNFFSAFMLSAILIFMTGLTREKTRSILCLLPGVLGLFLFGGPVLLVGNFQNFVQSIITSLQAAGLPGLINNLVTYPGYENFRGGNGSGVSGIAGMMYSNFYTFGLASFVLFVFLLIIQFREKYNLQSFILLIILSVLSSSVDETFFLIEISLIFFLLIYQLKKGFISKLPHIFLLIFIFITAFFVIQNPLRDSLLTPSPELPRFKFLIESNIPILKNITYKDGEDIRWNGKDIKQTASSYSKGSLEYLGGKTLSVNNTSWFIVDFKILAILILILGIFIKSEGTLFFIIPAILSAFCATLLINTYWIPNNLRFANQAGQLLMFGLGIFLVDLYVKNKKLFYFSLPIVFLALIPQFFTSHSKLFYMAFSSRHYYFTENQIDPLFSQIENLIPGSSKIIFLDAYPANSVSTYYNAAAFSRHGLFVPFSSFNPKVIGPEKGMEWFDAVNTLSPYAFKELNIEYLFVVNTSIVRLSDSNLKKINNAAYFKKIKSWAGADLYKVLPLFKDSDEGEMSIRKITSLLPRDSRVFLDKLYLSELRGIFLIQLSKKVHLIGPAFAHTGEFMYYETIIPFEDVCKTDPCNKEDLRNIKYLDYALMKPEDNPNLLFNAKFEKIASITHVDLWKAIKD